jgi:hypothetical protein
VWQQGETGEFVYGVYRNADGTMNPRWTHERSLIEMMRTAEDVNGGRVVFQFTNTIPSPVPRVVEIDLVEAIVEYRPPGSLRPLRGCLTTRPELNPEDPAATMHGVDYDWGVRSSTVAPPKSDNAYSASPTGSVGVGDSGSCTMLRVENPVKLHINGSVYAPTAGLDLRATDNDAQFVTGGLVVRHLTAYRWKQGGRKPAFGGLRAERADRTVVLSAYVPGETDPVCTSVVQFGDAGGLPGAMGGTVRRLRHQCREGFG